MYNFLESESGLVLIMGSPGCIKTVKYVFYVNVVRPDKLVLIKFVVNNLRNCRKQPTKKINHRNINTENCSKFSQNYLLIFFWNWKKTIWHYLLFANYFTTIYFFFGNFAISNYFTNSVTFGRLIMEHLDILISGIHFHIKNLPARDWTNHPTVGYVDQEFLS